MAERPKWKFTEAFTAGDSSVYYSANQLVIADDDGNEVFLTADRAAAVAKRILEVLEEAI